MVLSFVRTTDFHMKLARKLRITRRTSGPTVWVDVFDHLDKHIVIDFANGQRIYGWPMYYSDSPERPFIFLHRPYWIRNGKFVETELYGMLITPEQPIEAIEFLEEGAQYKEKGMMKERLRERLREVFKREKGYKKPPKHDVLPKKPPPGPPPKEPSKEKG